MEHRIRLSPLFLFLVLLPAASAAGQVPGTPVVGERVACTDGRAAGFPCRNVALLSFLPIEALGGATALTADSQRVFVSLNDLWGWTDPLTGKEYALVGRSDGTAFVDISDPVQPVFLGLLPAPDRVISAWRDIKTYADHAYIVSDVFGEPGMQVFDLRQLREVPDPPVTFTATSRYDGITQAHNIVVNEETGFAYAVGFEEPEGGTCGPGLHIIDLSEPARPTYAGCFSDLTTGRTSHGYTHDAQCVVYRGPDPDYQGREICIGSNETALSIADVTDKSAPAAISTGRYATYEYVHQGWLTEDQRYFLQDDELDEGLPAAPRTRTLIWDLADLDEPEMIAEYFGPTRANDHNQYIVGRLAYQANYKAGLRILDISRITEPQEVAFFDTYPRDDNTGFEGAWSNYPFFDSGVVIVSSIDEGLFVLEPAEDLPVGDVPEEVEAFSLSQAAPNPFLSETALTVSVDEPQEVTITVYDALGQREFVLFDGMLPEGVHPFLLEAPFLASGVYFVQVEAARFSEAIRVVKVE